MRKLFFVLFLFVCFAVPSLSKVIFSCPRSNQIALTFDDGPSPGFTDKILDILKKEKVKATFFVKGNKSLMHPALLLRIKVEGHDIGNHTYTHPALDRVSFARIKEELTKTDQIIEKITLTKPKTFRPPHGRLPPYKRRYVESLGYDVVLWTILADDFWTRRRGMPSANYIYRRVMGRVRGGDVILMHDNSKEIVIAVAMMIKSLKKRGFKFVTISEIS